MLLDGAFTVLLLLISGAPAATVPQLTNVTVSCQDFKVTARWEYSDQQPQTSFIVKVAATNGDSKNYTTKDHQYDLSQFIWKSEDNYMDLHHVSVTATQEGNQSEPKTSNSFSYNYLKTVHLTCKLGFPPVDVDVKDSGATVSFINPLHFYRELKQAIKPDTAYFDFRVTYDKDKSYDCTKCTVKEKNCKCDITFRGVEKCFTLNGLLFDRNNIGQVLFRDTDRICGDESTEVDWILVVIVLSVIVLVVIVVTVLICKAKAWTMSTGTTPRSLETDHRRPNLMRYSPVSDPDILVVEPSQRQPSLSSEEENNPESLQDSSASSDSPPAGAYGDGRALESSSQEGNRTDDESADDSVKTECVSMDLAEGEEEREEEVEEERGFVSHYDCPHGFQVDMDDDDIVTVYCKR